MMRWRNETLATPAIMAACALIPLVGGIVQGLRQDWMRMSLYLFGAVVMLFLGVIAFTSLQTWACFSRIENHFPNRERELPKASPLLVFGLTGVMVISSAVAMSLAVVALLRHAPFSLGVSLTACAVVVLMCVAGLMVLGITVRCRRLEILISTAGRD